MASPLEVEVTISSAKDLKNVNWRHGDLKPYAVVWVDPKSKCSTKVDDSGDTHPEWNETLLLPITSPLDDDSTLSIDIVHAYAAEDTKPLIGSARIPINHIIDDVGFGEWSHRTLNLKRPSGRPQGKLDVKVMIRQPRYRAPEAYYAPPPSYGYRAPTAPAPAPAPYPYGYVAGGAPSGYPYNPPSGQEPNPYVTGAPSGYPYNPPSGYPVQGGAYGAPPMQGYEQQQQQQKKGSKFGGMGMGTGLAVGAVAGALGGLAIAEGIDALEDKIADDVEEKVRDDLGLDDDDDYGDDF